MINWSWEDKMRRWRWEDEDEKIRWEDEDENEIIKTRKSCKEDENKRSKSEKKD